MDEHRKRLVEFAKRRNKILADLRQMKDDIGHWNDAHPNETPIEIDFDLTSDIKRLTEESSGWRGKA